MTRGDERRSLRRVSNPPNPWRRTRLAWDEDGVGEPPRATLQVYEDRTRRVLSRNDSPDLPFRWSVNPYRGCYHGCAYCYARPSHQYLDLGAGTDFEQQLVVKPDAPTLLRRAFERRSWEGELVVFSGNTDPYQPLDATWELTRRCLEVCRDFRNPVGLITKSALIERDADLLGELARDAFCSATVSIPFVDPDHARAVEPHVPSPRRRLRAVRTLAEAGVPVGVNVAPIIPGLNDEEAPRVLEAAAEAGAQWAGHTLVRLPGPVAPVFEERIREALPERADRILHQIEACRGGRRSDPRFGHRMQGQGARWEAFERLFETTCRRLGLDVGPRAPRATSFRRPGQAEQLGLL